ncbi:hypothetical protein AB0M43_34950 [Longispora sp. NPDC051575]|uniref:hypothetical protein n=1 Tax=Longispora sp. NPDC051575 TaxID=3154943 RepID=UPI003444F502
MSGHEFLTDRDVVDRLTAFLNAPGDVSGADAVEVLSELIVRSGRFLLDDAWHVQSQVVTGVCGVQHGRIQVGDYAVTAGQTPSGGVRVTITSPGDIHDRLLVVINGQSAHEVTGHPPGTAPTARSHPTEENQP